MQPCNKHAVQTWQAVSCNTSAPAPALWTGSSHSCYGMHEMLHRGLFGMAASIGCLHQTGCRFHLRMNSEHMPTGLPAWQQSLPHAGGGWVSSAFGVPAVQRRCDSASYRTIWNICCATDTWHVRQLSYLLTHQSIAHEDGLEAR